MNKLLLLYWWINKIKNYFQQILGKKTTQIYVYQSKSLCLYTDYLIIKKNNISRIIFLGTYSHFLAISVPKQVTGVFLKNALKDMLLTFFSKLPVIFFKVAFYS